MGDEAQPVLGQDFENSLKPTMGPLVTQTLQDVDYMFLGDWHLEDTQLEWLARPDIMRGISEGGVTVLDLELLGPDLVHLAQLYHDDVISLDTLEFFYVDVYGASNLEEDNTAEMESVVRIVDQAKDLGLRITSTNHQYPTYSENEFQIKAEYDTALIEYQARHFEALDMESLTETDKISQFGRTERAFRAENPDLYQRMLAVSALQQLRWQELAVKIEAQAPERFADIPQAGQQEAVDYLVLMGEQGGFVQDAYENLSPDAKETLLRIFDQGAEMKMRFDDDENVASRMEQERGDGKMLSVWGAIHFDRNPVLARPTRPDIDHALGEGRTASFRVFADQESFQDGLSTEYNKVQALFGYDLSDAPDVTIDLSNGTWTNKNGSVTAINTDIPLSDRPALAETPSTPEVLEQQGGSSGRLVTLSGQGGQ